MNDTVSFLLEGLRGRDCQGISLDDPLDTAMMVLSGVGSHYTGHGKFLQHVMAIRLSSCWPKDASHYADRGLSFHASFWRFDVCHADMW